MKEDIINEVSVFVETEWFVIFKTASGRYYVYDHDNDNYFGELEIVFIDNNDDKSEEELLDVDFEFDYSGEELEGTSFYYFKTKND